MKKALTALFALLILSALNAGAEIDREIMTLTTHTPTSTWYCAATNSNIRGYIDEIVLDVVTAGTTGQLAIVLKPELSTLANVTLIAATNANSDLTYRPRVYPTDTAGTALSTDAARYIACGDSLIFSVTNASATNIQFKAVIKYQKR